MKKATAAAAALLALAWPAAATPSRDGMRHVAGSGIGSGAVAGDHVEVGARADADGSNPTGHIELAGIFPSGTTVHLGGRVDCLRVVDNRAVALARLPEPFTSDEFPGLVFTHLAVVVEDNGPPVDGQPVDRMLDFVLREATAESFCTTDAAFVFLAALGAPLASGNFVVDN
jgi:hypothetical protein